MLKWLLKFWRKIIYLGTSKTMSPKLIKKALQNNFLGVITMISFHVFYVFIYLISNENKQYILLSYGCILLVAFIVYTIAANKKSLLAKIIAMLNIYAGIIFFDIYLGTATGMAVYYIPFLFFATRFFSYKKNKRILIFFVFLPILFQLLIGLFCTHCYDPNILTAANVKTVRTFNFGFAFLLTAASATYVSFTNYINDEKLFNANLALQTLIDNNKASLWSITQNYEIITANAQYIADMKEIFNEDIGTGYDYKKILARTDYPDEWRKQLDKVMSGMSFADEYMHNNEIYELHAAPIIKGGNEVIGAVFYARNINQRKVNEQKIANTNKELEKALIAKEQFLSSMSHELRTPLNGILGIANLLHQEAYLDTQKGSLEMLKYSSEHMLDIVNDILDYNKIDAGKLELESTPIHLASLVQQVVSFFEQQAKEKNLTLRVNNDSIKDLIVLGDVLRIRQVLNNLISNAIKFTQKGSVTITIDKKREHANEVSIQFTITDTGIGIPHNKLDSIFKSFTQADARINRKFGGTGLGLTISDKLIQLMDSKIYVESIHGKGSSFWFTLEMPLSEKISIEQVVVKELTPFQKTYALLAEDNKINITVMKRFLIKWNIEVTEAENGAIALDLCKNNNYDIIFMDLEMPVMDGLTAVKHIRTFNTTIPIIALTASTGENLRENLIAAGMNDYVAKPFKPEEIHTVISSFIK
jgi:signal transduction histidine kinase/CheY-like chemotaxis protein